MILYFFNIRMECEKKFDGIFYSVGHLGYLRTGDARSEMPSVQVAESIKLEKTELEFELGQLTGQVERLQARIRTLIEEQVTIVPQALSSVTGFVLSVI